MRLPQSDRRAPQALPPHTTILYVGVKADHDIVLPSGLSFSITVPPAFITHGQSYYIVFYNPAIPDWVVYAGPATINGSTVTFTANGGPITLHANVTYWFALISTGGVIPTPTPTPSPTPSPSETCKQILWWCS